MGTSIPGAYKVGGRRVLKSTDKNRDSSLKIDKAPEIVIHTYTAAPLLQCRADRGGLLAGVLDRARPRAQLLLSGMSK